MPRVMVVFFKDDDGSVPLRAWLDVIPRKAHAECLARLVGTTASVICRLEDADYEGHSLSMLRRIAAALHKRVEIRFVPVKRKRALA